MNISLPKIVTVLSVIISPLAAVSQVNIENNTGIIVTNSSNVNIDINTEKRFTSYDSIYIMNAISYFEAKDTVKIVNIIVETVDYCNVRLYVADLMQFLDRHGRLQGSGTASGNGVLKGINFEVQKFPGNDRRADFMITVGAFYHSNDNPK